MCRPKMRVRMGKIGGMLFRGAVMGALLRSVFGCSFVWWGIVGGFGDTNVRLFCLDDCEVRFGRRC